MFNEAREHAEGRLHYVFADPYSAFDNLVTERQLHLRVALQELVGEPLANNRLTLRIIHGWENGSFEPAELAHCDHPLASLNDLEQVCLRYQEILQNDAPLPSDEPLLLAAPLAEAINIAEASEQNIDAETRAVPARWPTFDGGLLLYTFFKVYHRLTYGEDDRYRSIHCETQQGPREIHEFHIEEGDFAVIRPAADAAGDSILLLHVSQLDPMRQLLEASGF